MPKVIVSGRGGSGKSTVTTVIAKAMAGDGPVLVVDADESNLGLPAMLGIDPPARTVMEHLGGRDAVRDQLMAALRSGSGERVPFFRDGVAMEELPRECVSRSGGLTFVRVGKIEHSLQGCACPEGAVARAFVGGLTVGDGWVLVDTEAGVEHFGRGLLEGADLVLVVADPSHEAVLLVDKAAGLAEEAGKPCGVVLSQVDDETATILREELRPTGAPILGSLPHSTPLARAHLRGEPLALDGVAGAVSELRTAIEAALQPSIARS